MPTTVIFIGDPHIQVSNIPEVDLFIERITKLCTEKQPDFIVIGGDLLHTHERLHTVALNKAYELVNTMRLITKTYVLVGNHDMCLGENIKVLTINNNSKLSQHIVPGDVIIGDDGFPCKVLTTCTGYDEMYLVIQENGMDYTVNSNHILSLISELNVTMDIPISEYMSYPINIKEKLYGLRVDIINNKKVFVKTSITVEYIGYGKYYGWSVSSANNRFLLEDRTVTHNCNNQQFLTENHWLNGMKEWDNTVIVDKVITETINGEKFVFSPYVAPGRFQEALDTIDGWRDATCIFAHQEFAGCKMGAIVSVEGDKWPLDYPHVVSGHIHSRQIPQNNIYYTGSAMQHAFGESEKNIIGYLTFDKNTKDYKREEIDLLLPRKKIVYMDVEDVDTYDATNTSDSVKVTLSGSYDQFKALKKTKKYTNLIEKGIKVVFKPKKIKNVDDVSSVVSSSNDFTTILSSLVTDQKNAYLVQAYELVVNGKQMSRDDIMFL